MRNWHWSRQWKSLRAEVFNERPICEDCNAAPPEILAHVVQPIVGGSWFDKSNLLALCKPCDRKRTASTTVVRQRPGKWRA